MRQKLNGFDSNEEIKKLILKEDPFLITRVGLGGETIVSVLEKYNQTVPNDPKFWFHNNAGFYGTSDYKRYSNMYFSACQKSDLHAYWSDPIFSQYEDILVPNNKKLIDPSSLESFRFDDPWTNFIGNKKVLIISPFKSDMEKQIPFIDKIWNNKLKFNNIIFYESIQSIGGDGPDSDWYESYDKMCSEISKINFDIALLGCGSYGLPLSLYIRNINKSAVYIGGGLQLYFGLLGKRWENNSDILTYVNEYWKRPNKNKNYEKVEGGCYW